MYSDQLFVLFLTLSSFAQIVFSFQIKEYNGMFLQNIATIINEYNLSFLH